MHVFMFSTFDQLKLTDASISAEVEESFVDRLPRTSGYCQYAVVEYENHKAAAVARRALIPCYGHILAIDWAIPSKEKRPRGQVINYSLEISCTIATKSDFVYRVTAVPLPKFCQLSAVKLIRTDIRLCFLDRLIQFLPLDLR